MRLSLLDRFILWLKKMFHFNKKKYIEEIPRSKINSIDYNEMGPIVQKSQWVDEKNGISLEVDKKKHVEKKEFKEKNIELEEENKQPYEDNKIQEESNIEIEQRDDKNQPKDKKTKVKEKTGMRKPYKKKGPTEERKNKNTESYQERKAESGIPKLASEIDLGKRKQLRPTEQSQTTASPKQTVKESGERQIITIIESPYVEIDLDEARILLIIPEQQLEIREAPQQLYYDIAINGNKQMSYAKITNHKERVIIEEKKIELKYPLKDFKIVYPNELQGRVYCYHHSNENLYAFIAIGNNRGRMHYLSDKEENNNPLPKKDVWILLKEGFELAVEPDTIEERWIWEKYKPFRINLKNTNEIVINNKKSREKNKIHCESTFTIEGDKLVEDDFKEQSPLFIDKAIKIIAPIENPYGWVVSIQNKHAGYKIISDNWTGNEAFEIKLPDDLPCECGEYQLDICEQNDRIPIGTLFFRYIPNLRLDFPKELIIPDPDRGHKKEIVKIILARDSKDWELKHDKNFETIHIENGYQIELPLEHDIVRFSLTKKDKPETETNFKITISRLKWKVSQDEKWDDRPLQLNRDQLIASMDFYFILCTNDFDKKYDISAFIETEGQILQESKFIHKGIKYELLLNKFYDTINKNQGKITLRIEIGKARSSEILGQADVMYLAEITKEKFQNRQAKKSISFRPLDRNDIKVMGGKGKIRRGKGFSKKELIKVGITVNTIRSLPILFDKRRKTEYSENTKILKSLTGDE